MFHYCGYYQLLAAMFALITVSVVGFYGFNFLTVVCALVTALCLTAQMFAGIIALRGCTLVVSQMIGAGSLVIPCIFGALFLNEPMSIWDWVGLSVFLVSIYFLVSQPKSMENQEKVGKMSLKTVIALAVCLFAEGFTMVFQKIFALRVPNGNESMYSLLMFAMNAVILYTIYLVVSIVAKNKASKNVLHIDEKAKPKTLQPLSKKLLICGVLLSFALFAVNLLVTTLAKTIPSAVLFTASYAISIGITILVSTLIYKEKLTWKNGIGIVLGLFAIIIINVL
jgi:drug/metabolite transporter (DMT)-like permease